MPRTKSFGQERIQVLPQHVRGRRAEDLFGTLVEMNDAMRVVDRDHSVGGNCQNAGEHRIGRVPLLLQSLSLGEEGANGSLPLQRETRGAERSEQRTEPEPARATGPLKQIVQGKAERYEQGGDCESHA